LEKKEKDDEEEQETRYSQKYAAPISISRSQVSSGGDTNTNTNKDKDKDKDVDEEAANCEKNDNETTAPILTHSQSSDMRNSTSIRGSVVTAINFVDVAPIESSIDMSKLKTTRVYDKMRPFLYVIMLSGVMLYV
jgi:hypothetical protein|tara:strand:+ start:187 stop:591 length:405 start_codon:yes stop_codon:yes gene_type:complete